jgi:hypothetical protein
MSSGLKNFLITRSLLRNTLMTTLFYSISWIILELLNIYSPGGPCVPGGGDMLFFLLVPIVITLFVINTYKAFAVSTTYTISVLLHLAAILCILYSIRS